MKTKDELNALKNEIERLKAKLAELTDEELKEVVGGRVTACCDTVKQEYTTVGCQFNNGQIDNSQITGSKFTYNSAYSGGAIFPSAQNDQPGNDLQFK